MGKLGCFSERLRSFGEAPVEPKGEDCWTGIWKTELEPAMIMVERAGNTSPISLRKSLKKNLSTQEDLGQLAMGVDKLTPSLQQCRRRGMVLRC